MSESQGQGTQSSQSSSPSKVSGPTSTRNKSVRKQQQPRASCWSHFNKYVTEDGQKRARCNHCDTTYTMETRGSTTSLNNHMKVCLQKPNGNTSDIKQSELSFANVGDGPESEKTNFSTWKFDRDVIKKALIHMIVVDELPFRIVEGEGFKQFLSIACPRGESIGQALEKFIWDWGIERVFTITVDNASANGVEIHCLLDEWLNCDDLDIVSMASKMKEKYNKYLGDATTINFLVYLAIILDPQRKMGFVDFRVQQLFPNVASEVMKMVERDLHCLFDEYSSTFGRVHVHGQSSIPTKVSMSSELHQSRMSLAVQQYLLKKQRVGSKNKPELDKYLTEEEDENNSTTFDLLLWWKVNSPRYPILSQMARDVFSIPISIVSSESAFSTGGRVLDGFRSSLTPTMVEALICTQDWLRKSKESINLDGYVVEVQDVEDGKALF
ncbi:hypothetical protein GQ457_17G006270 [Hibiscus cannabinus]